jgi:hypothetical protein
MMAPLLLLNTIFNSVALALLLAAAPNLGCSWARAHGRLEVARKKMFRKENYASGCKS